MRISSNRTLNRALFSAVAAAMTATVAHADLAITNGNFESYAPGAGVNSAGVYQWFNAQNLDNPNTTAVDPAPWYFNVSQATAVSPTGTASVVMTGNHDPAGGVPIPWIYQSIGFNTGGLTSLPITFDLGGFTDNNPISAHIDVQLFKATGFTGADNTDIVGAAGVTQVGSTFSVERLSFAGNSGVINVPATFDLTGVTATDELFLRFQSTVPAGWTGSNYVRLDNIKIVGGPVNPPVALTWVGSAAGGTWDNKTTADFKAGSTASTFKEGDLPTFDNSAPVNGSNVTNVTVAGAVSPGNTVIDSNHDYSFTGGSIIGVDPTTTLTKRGTGKATFTNALTFNGGTKIEAGSIELTGSAGAIIGPIVDNGTLILNRTYTDPAAINEWDPLFIRDEISGTGGLVIKNHAFIGEERNTAKNNTFTGPVVIEGGFTYLGDVNGLGSTVSGTTVMSGATLAVVDEFHLGANATIAEPLTLNGRGVVSWFNGGFETGALFQWESTRTFTGPIHLASSSLIITRGTSVMKLTGPLTAAPGASLEKQGTGALEFTGVTLEGLTVYGGTLKQTAGTTKTKSLYLESGVTYDLTGSSLAVDYDAGASTPDDIKALVAAKTIFTSLDPANYMVGVIENAKMATPLTSFNGVPVDATSILVRGTIIGDINLNGTVNFDDLLTLAKNYNGSNKLYQDGDIATPEGGTPGLVNFDDLLALAKHYNQSVPTAAAGFSEQFVADFALAQSLVPEPTSLALIGGLGLTLGARRRSRKA